MKKLVFYVLMFMPLAAMQVPEKIIIIELAQDPSSLAKDLIKHYFKEIGGMQSDEKLADKREAEFLKISQFFKLLPENRKKEIISHIMSYEEGVSIFACHVMDLSKKDLAAASSHFFGFRPEDQQAILSWIIDEYAIRSILTKVPPIITLLFSQFDMKQLGIYGLLLRKRGGNFYRLLQQELDKKFSDWIIPLNILQPIPPFDSQIKQLLSRPVNAKKIYSKYKGLDGESQKKLLKYILLNYGCKEVEHAHVALMALMRIRADLVFGKPFNQALTITSIGQFLDLLNQFEATYPFTPDIMEIPYTSFIDARVAMYQGIGDTLLELTAITILSFIREDKPIQVQQLIAAIPQTFYNRLLETLLAPSFIDSDDSFTKLSDNEKEILFTTLTQIFMPYLLKRKDFAVFAHTLCTAHAKYALSSNFVEMMKKHIRCHVSETTFNEYVHILQELIEAVKRELSKENSLVG